MYSIVGNDTLDTNDLIYNIPGPGVDFTNYIVPLDKEKIYEIDLNSRTIKVPEFLSVVTDHNSLVVWFRVDRFYDNYDLYGSSCWIQYRNADKKEFICVTYPQPINDGDHDSLYIPWPISRAVAAASGNVEFSIRFF